MNVTFIHHSSFLVESETALLLFDYFEGTLPPLDRGKPLYVFASHRHGDHFSPEIFSLAEPHPKVHYFLSDDIWHNRVPETLLPQVTFCPPRNKILHEGLTVETLRSTDEGVAFWITVDNRHIYHAGDLNDWQWEGEPEDWNRNMQADYHTEIDRLDGRTADLAFLPLDPRQEAWYASGIDYFRTKVRVLHLFPMHCWEDFSVIGRYHADHPDCPLYPIAARGDHFIL